MTQAQRKTLGLAIASFVLGCFFLIPLIGFLLSLPAIILGIVALVKISRSNNTLGGTGLAISGIVMGAIAILIIPIIAILSAIAIPNFFRARLLVNETSAVSSIRMIITACETYRAEQTPPRYPPSLAELADANVPYIDAELGSCVKNGYAFRYCLINAGSYTITASPLTENVTGRRFFFADETGVIRLNDATGPPLE